MAIETLQAPYTPELLNEVVSRIVAASQPEAVILFGSRARGNAREDSDLDFIVVIPNAADPGVARQQVYAKLYEALMGIRSAIDLLVYTRSEFSARANVIGTVVWDAVREGKVLYGNP